MKNLSNILAVSGAIGIVVGIGMFRIAAGVIALGVVLVLGAMATLRLDEEKALATKGKAGAN